MQINKISGNNFGAIPDIPTRNLFKRASIEGIDTKATENLLKSIHADKYAIMTKNKYNFVEINLCNKQEGVITKVRNILTYDEEEVTLRNIIETLKENLQRISKERTKAQKQIDRIENKFGKYDERDIYKHSQYYLDT